MRYLRVQTGQGSPRGRSAYDPHRQLKTWHGIGPKIPGRAVECRCRLPPLTAMKWLPRKCPHPTHGRRRSIFRCPTIAPPGRRLLRHLAPEPCYRRPPLPAICKGCVPGHNRPHYCSFRTSSLDRCCGRTGGQRSVAAGGPGIDGPGGASHWKDAGEAGTGTGGGGRRRRPPHTPRAAAMPSSASPAP